MENISIIHIFIGMRSDIRDDLIEMDIRLDVLLPVREIATASPLYEATSGSVREYVRFVRFRFHIAVTTAVDI